MIENEKIEKAIRVMQQHKCEEISLYGEEYNLAIKALKKQIVKKVKGIDMCTCPNCGTYNETAKKRRKTVNQDIVYCWHCGQAMEINRNDIGSCR